jgi:hypothetical protein
VTVVNTYDDRLTRVIQSHARGTSPDAWIAAARDRPTYRTCHGSER